MVSEEVVSRVSGAYGLNLVLTRSFLNLVKDRIFVSDSIIALYFKLDDDTLELLRYGLLDITDGKEVIRLFGKDGCNLHFVGVVSNGSGIFSLRSVGRALNCSSISWFTPDLGKFVYFKRR